MCGSGSVLGIRIRIHKATELGTVPKRIRIHNTGRERGIFIMMLMIIIIIIRRRRRRALWWSTAPPLPKSSLKTPYETLYSLPGLWRRERRTVWSR